MTTNDSEWQRVVQQVTTSATANDNEWYNTWQRVVQRMTTSGTTSDNEWYNEWQRVITSDNKWQRMATSDKKWQRMVQRVTTNDNEWQRVTISANFSFFQVREESTTKHPKENSLNLEENLWRRPNELRAETIPWEKILTVKSRNGRNSCSQILMKISVIKNFAVFTGKHLCWSLFLWKLQVLKRASPLKGNSNTGVFLWILQNF